MDGELRQYLEGMEQRIMQRIDGRIDASEERMKGHVSKELERVETKLLAEFWKWGRTSDIRNREAMSAAGEASTRTQLLSERLMNAEDRISELERQRGAA